MKTLSKVLILLLRIRFIKDSFINCSKDIIIHISSNFLKGTIKVQLALDDDAIKALGGGGGAAPAAGGGEAGGKGEMGTMQALALGALLAGGGGKGGGGDDKGGGGGGGGAKGEASFF